MGPRMVDGMQDVYIPFYFLTVPKRVLLWRSQYPTPLDAMTAAFDAHKLTGALVCLLPLRPPRLTWVEQRHKPGLPPVLRMVRSGPAKAFAA